MDICVNTVRTEQIKQVLMNKSGDILQFVSGSFNAVKQQQDI